MPTKNIFLKIYGQIFFGFLFFPSVSAQHYFGAGFHINPPVRIDNCCNSFVQVKPLIIPSISFTYKKEWESKRKKGWYREIGLTNSGLYFNYEHYFNDTSTAWVDFDMNYVGFPSILYGMGRVFPMPNNKNKQEFSVGLEGSFRLEHTLGGLRTRNFGLTFSSDDITFPFFLRLNLGYIWHFKMLNQIPAHLQLYTKLSFQDIARSPQYIRDPSTGQIDNSGKYRLNNSELGLMLYTDLGKEYYRFNWEKKKKGPKRKRSGPSNFRISVDGQIYAPPATQYYIPRVDSFSLKGFGFALTAQYGIKAEFIHAKNKNWATVVGIGFGEISENYQFKAKAEYTMDGLAVSSGFHSSPFNTYLIPSAGFSYKHHFNKKAQLQHSFLATLVIPLEKEISGFGQIERSFLGTPPHLVPTHILYGEVDYKYGRAKVVPGIEYQPELLFHMDRRIFYGFGLVFNYSYGTVGHGRVVVDNGRTPYFGGLTQGFSKIGITARIGWRSDKFE